MKQVSIGVVVLAVLSVHSASFAAVLSADDATFGVGSLTRDTAQNLEFLDLTLTQNRSFNDVSSQLGVGGEFEGFRYATYTELATLINNAGWIDGSSNPLDTGTIVAASIFEINNSSVTGMLVNLFGITNVGVNSVSSNGILADPAPGGGPQQTVIRLTEFDSGDGGIGGTQIDLPLPNASYGSFLVRLVPAPGVAGLIGFAGFGTLLRPKRLSQ